MTPTSATAMAPCLIHEKIANNSSSKELGFSSTSANLHICSGYLDMLSFFPSQAEGKRAFSTWNQVGHENSISSKETSTVL
jgi:hypothetical protein